MLVLPDKKAVALKLREPERVTSVIPDARVMNWKGVPITIIPHRLDETLVLKNLGHQVPSPVHYQYEWSGSHDPFRVQKVTVDMLTLYPRAYVLNDMGAGKTISSLWAFDYLKKKGKVNRMMVVAPLSTLERAWADQVFAHFPHLNFAVLHGSRKKRLDLLADRSFDIYIINHDGMNIVCDDMKHRDDIDLIILDELAVLRNQRTTRWKAANELCNKHRWGVKARRVWGMTATPTPNEPTDAYAQIKLVTPEKMTFGYTKFRDMVMQQIGQHLWIPRRNAQEIVASYMHPSVRFSLDECVELPELVYVQRDAPLSHEQAEAYNQMMSQLAIEVANGEVLAVNEGTKASKLIQIACSVVYDVDGIERILPGGESRMAVVKELLEESASGKAVVFCPFRAVVWHVVKKLRAAGYKVAGIDSGVTKRERDVIFRRFQEDKDLRVLVAIPSCMSHGLTLTAASTIIWYAPITSNDTFTQANGRCHRPGQKHKGVVAMISGTPIERLYYQRLKNKQKAQGVLLDLLRTDKRT